MKIIPYQTGVPYDPLVRALLCRIVDQTYRAWLKNQTEENRQLVLQANDVVWYFDTNGVPPRFYTRPAAG